MGHFKSLDEAREFFAKDNYAGISGIKLESFDDESAVASMEIKDIHRNGLGGVMGGAIFTLGDFAFAVACNNNHMPSVAVNVSINYLTATKGTKLYAKSKCIRDGKTTGVYQVMITDDLGKEIALFTGTSYKINKEQ